MKNLTQQENNLMNVAKKLNSKGYTSSAIYHTLKKGYLCTNSLAIKIMKLSNINIG